MLVKKFLFVLVCICFLFSGCSEYNKSKEQSPVDLDQKSLYVSDIADVFDNKILNVKQKDVVDYSSLEESVVYQEYGVEQTAGNTLQQAFEPFYVYYEKGSPQNHYIPSGFMPNGKCLSLSDGWMSDCHSAQTCIKVEYDLQCSRQDQRWAGIYWLNPANNWGGRKGGFNLTGAEKLVFWAKGNKGGEQINEVIVGGISGDYPDSDKTWIGPIILTDKWRKYTIDLRGKDLSYISGGFGWSTSEGVNQDSCIFYLDDIRYE
ncbi:MAG: hypothetical protein P9X22_06335 [Candidatus Zapsychrus exili]|nr:hypothetical protein [Candidatus Zapsychrus exili]